MAEKKSHGLPGSSNLSVRGCGCEAKNCSGSCLLALSASLPAEPGSLETSPGVHAQKSNVKLNPDRLWSAMRGTGNGREGARGGSHAAVPVPG